MRIGNDGLLVWKGWHQKLIGYHDLLQVEIRQAWWMKLPMLRMGPFVSIRTAVRPGWPISGVFSRRLSFQMEPDLAKEFVEELSSRMAPSQFLGGES